MRKIIHYTVKRETELLSKISKLRFVLKLLRTHHLGTTLTIKGSEHDNIIKQVDEVLEIT